jgi:osmotically-inducible protein OsmY
MRTQNSKRALVGLLALCVIAFGAAACKKGPEDASITASVKAKLAADAGTSATAINVDTKEGVVTLSGAVSSEAEKSKAEQIAKATEGVKSVTNNLTVKLPTPTPVPVNIASDTALKNTVEANLAKYKVTGVSVAVSGGEVTLTGNLPRAKLPDAMKAANEASPKKVNNQLVLK